MTCRLAQTDIPKDQPDLWKLDNAKEENLKELEKLGAKVLAEKVSKLNFNTGKLVIVDGKETFEDALNR